MTLAITLSSSLLILNALALLGVGGYLLWRYFSLRRTPEAHDPSNLEEFYPDEVLEGRKLERVLGWALVMTIIVAVALPLYFLLEPDRQSSADDDYLDRSIERGATLYANDQMAEYDAAFSLQCANCHGADLKGGSATGTVTPTDTSDPACTIDEQTGECFPIQVDWQAPPLDSERLIYTREQVTEIITYGRPGTPMPAWGVESGEGVLNTQGIEDLVNFIESEQISSDEAMKRTQDEFDQLLEDAEQGVADAQEALDTAEQELADAPANQQTAQENVDAAEEDLVNAQDYLDTVQEASEGEILFWNNCARCHTQGWSYYNPLEPDEAPPPGPMGGGAFGPALDNGSELRQFPGSEGPEMQYDFVANGADRNEQYGVRGVSSGGMPHFSSVMTKKQIEAIVDYERGL